MQDAIDGVVAGDILDLSTAEVVLGGQGADIGIAQRGEHLVPDAHAGLQRGLVELDLVEETTLEGLVHVLREVGGGDEDAVEGLHLLKDDVLDVVLHLINGAFRAFL